MPAARQKHAAERPESAISSSNQAIRQNCDAVQIFPGLPEAILVSSDITTRYEFSAGLFWIDFDVGTHVAISQADTSYCRETGGTIETLQPGLFATWNYLKSSLGSPQQQPSILLLHPSGLSRLPAARAAAAKPASR
jgi:hypothetical protein